MGEERHTGRRPLYDDADAAPKSRKRKAEEEKKRFERIAQILDDALRERLKELYEERDRLYQRLTEIEQERTQNSAQIDALKQRYDDLEAERIHAMERGSFERNPDGTFKSKALEDAVAEYEKRTGKKVDRNNFDEVYALLIEAQDRAETERKAREKRDHELLEEGQGIAGKIDDIDKKISEAEQALKTRDALDVHGDITKHMDKYERDGLITAAHESGADLKNVGIAEGKRCDFTFNM
jgi:hypothetical protein